MSRNTFTFGDRVMRSLLYQSKRWRWTIATALSPVSYRRGRSQAAWARTGSPGDVVVARAWVLVASFAIGLLALAVWRGSVWVAGRSGWWSLLSLLSVSLVTLGVGLFRPWLEYRNWKGARPEAPVERQAHRPSRGDDSSDENESGS